MQLKPEQLILAGLLLAPLSFSRAQTDTIAINEVILSGRKAESHFSEVSRVVSTLSKEELEDLPAQSIMEALDEGLGIDIRNRGVMGVQADMSIRGGSFDQNLVLLNGVAINDPQTGHHNLNIPISLDQVDKIEVLHGPGSRIFGPNAFSGAVNIITRPPEDQDKVHINLSGGAHGYLHTAMSGSFSHNGFANNLSFSSSRSDGYMENTDFDISNIFYQGHVGLDSGSLHVQLGHMNKKFGANSFYTPVYPDQFEAINSTLVSLRHTTDRTFRLENRIYYRRHQDRFELFRDEWAPWYTGHNHHLTTVLGTGSSYGFNTPLGRTTLGFEQKYEKILSNVLGQAMKSTMEVSGEEAVFTHRDERLNLGLFMEHTMVLGQFSFTAGALYNWNTQFDHGIYPGLEISYFIGNNYTVSGSFSRALRLPTFTDLYYEGPTNLGNPDLMPETALNYELVFKLLDREGVRGQVAVFRREGNNIIDWVRLSDTLQWNSENITTLVTNGLDLGFLMKGSVLNTRRFNYLKLHYTFVDLEKHSGEYISNYALDFLKHKLALSLNHDVVTRVKAGWSLQYLSRAGTYTDFDTGMETPYTPVFLVNGKISYRHKWMHYFVSCTNMFNVRYQDIGNIRMPGRWIKGGISVDLNL